MLYSTPLGEKYKLSHCEIAAGLVGSESGPNRWYQPGAVPLCENHDSACCGSNRIEIAKMIEITPALLRRNGMYVDRPANILRPTVRRACCTGTRRWPWYRKMIETITIKATTIYKTILSTDSAP